MRLVDIVNRISFNCYVFTDPDLLREELNRRFLASQDRSSLLGSMPQFMRADIHQHMHQHQHQHMHQHTYSGMPPPAISAPSLVPAPPPSPVS